MSWLEARFVASDHGRERRGRRPAVTDPAAMRRPREVQDPLAHALAYADALHNLARYLVRSEADAEDLVQETYARAFGAAERLEPGSNVKAWLFRILRNAFLSSARRARHDPTDRDVELDDPAAEVPGQALRGDAELEAMRGLVGQEIEAALRELGADARTAILLDLEGFSELEMSTILDCAPGTVKSRLSRARAALRQRLADYATAERR